MVKLLRCPQGRGGTRTIAGVNPMGMLGYTRNSVYLNMRPQRINGLIESNFPFLRAGR